MGNLDFSANADQLKELAAYMASQINVPTIGIGGGYAPIGTIIPLMGTTAPQDYLACDGTVYSIADYPQLADYFESQFGESNHFGGNGTTTFAVPDLQGEFLRGTGTNSHTGNGDGANVGTHQDATKQLNSGYAVNDHLMYLYPDSNTWKTVQNEDSKTETHTYPLLTTTLTNQNASSGQTFYTSRPTNTSVLYCIKAVVAGEVYSTEERVVGTWIDGKPLYQKTVVITNTVLGATTEVNHNIENINKIIDYKVVMTGNLNRDGFVIPVFINTSSIPIGIEKVNATKIIFHTAGYTASEYESINVTIQYTKTTD